MNCRKLAETRKDVFMLAELLVVIAVVVVLAVAFLLTLGCARVSEHNLFASAFLAGEALAFDACR